MSEPDSCFCTTCGHPVSPCGVVVHRVSLPLTSSCSFRPLSRWCCHKTSASRCSFRLDTGRRHAAVITLATPAGHGDVILVGEMATELRAVHPGCIRLGLALECQQAADKFIGQLARTYSQTNDMLKRLD